MWIYIAHHRGTSNAALYALVRCKQKRFWWNCLCRQSGLSDTQMSSRLMGLPQRKPVGQKNSVGSAVCPEAVGWRIWDAAEMWLRRVGCRSRSGTGVLGLSDSCAPWRWACTWLALVVKVERSVLTTINEDVMLHVCDHHHYHHVFSHMEKCTFTDCNRVSD